MVTGGSSEASSKIVTGSKTDPGWKYCHPLREGDTNNVVCNFCDKVTKGGITRAKYHLMGKKGNVASCLKCPKDVREELWAYFREKEKNNTEKEVESVAGSCTIDLESLGFGYDEEEKGLRDIIRGKKKAKTTDSMKGPMDLYMFEKPESVLAKRKKEKMRQTSIREACDKEARDRVNQYIARWFYQDGFSLNAVKLKSFQHMIEDIGAYGPGLKEPTYHEIRVPLLNKEVEYTNKLMQNHKAQWEKHGCSIMSDGWSDRKQRGLINFMVNSPAGTMFLKSVDASKYIKTGEKIFEYLDALIDEIGENKVIQVITDNGSNYVLAGKMLEQKRKNLYWTPCAAHCIDLMLEDIGKIPEVKKTIQKAITLVGFIYNHSVALSMMRSFTNKKELVRHAITRFATSFLSLERLYKEKENIKRMFFSEQWAKCNLAKDPKGKEAAKIALMPSFWPKVVYALKVMGPLVKVLRLVDSEKKPAMGYIYEAMDKAKEAIMKSFKEDERKYKEIFEIIDKRWDCQLHRPLHAAGHFLNPEYYYDNPSLEFDLEVTSGLYECIKRLVPSQVQQPILGELPIYKSASGLFGNDFAKSQRKIIAPGERLILHEF